MSRFDDRYLNYGDVYSIIMQAKTVDQAMSVLHLPYVEMPKWIPVSERLPEKHQYVLVTYNGLDGRRLVVVTNWNPNTWIESKSVAWMPVPEPFKGGE